MSSFYDQSNHSDTPAPSAESAQATAQQANDAVKAAAVDAETKAARLFDSMPQGEKSEPVAQKTEADRAATLYSPESTYGDTVLIAEVPAGATAEQIAAANSETRQEFAKLELPGVMARQITERFTTAMKAPIDDATYEAKAASFTSELARRFGGAEHVEERLQDVRTLLAKAHPAVTDALIESGLNVDADTVFELAQHARSLKGRGRL